MPNFATHATAGAMVGAMSAGVSYAFWGFDTPVLAMCGVAGFIGSLSPDMDVKSTSSRICYLLVLLGAIYLAWNENMLIAILLLCYSVVPQLFTHRGAFHTILFGLITSGLLALLLYVMSVLEASGAVVVGASFMAGFFTHLLMDDL